MRTTRCSIISVGIAVAAAGCTTFTPHSATRRAAPDSRPASEEQEKVAEPPSASEPVSAEEEESVATESAAEGADEEESVAETEDAEGRTVASVCEALCARVDERCSKDSARQCRGQCKIYVEKSKGCEAEYRAALDCQAGAAQKELCGNVAAANCLDEFRDIKRCQRGEKTSASDASAPASGSGLPAGWKMITDDQLGFKIGLPASAALDRDAERRTWSATVGDVEYVVAQLPSPNKPITSQVLLKLVIDYVGYRCQKNLKLHGQFEIGDEVAIRYDTVCRDGTEWHGMLRVRPDQAKSTAYHAKSGAEGVLEPFIYSYKRL